MEASTGNATESGARCGSRGRRDCLTVTARPPDEAPSVAPRLPRASRAPDYDLVLKSLPSHPLASISRMVEAIERVYTDAMARTGKGR